MTIKLLAIGKTDNKQLQALIDDYQKRLGFYVKFEFENTQELLERFAFSEFSKDSYLANKASIVIWTTTPWTLPANEAVSVHPGIEYALVHLKESDELLVLAAELVNDAMGRYGIEADGFDTIAFAKGADFGWVVEGEKLTAPTKVKHPFMPNDDDASKDKYVPVITGLHVTADSGTGSVHTAVSYTHLTLPTIYSV